MNVSEFAQMDITQMKLPENVYHVTINVKPVVVELNSVVNIVQLEVISLKTNV